MSFFGRGLRFLGYVYLVRVPLLTWALMVTLWLGSFSGSGAEPILRGIFDVASRQSSVFATAAEIGTVTLAALLAGTSMGVSARLTVCNAHLRFRATPVELTPGLELLFRFVPFVSFVAVVGTVLVRSEAPWAGKLPGLVLGAGVWYVVTVGAKGFVNSLHLRLVARFQAGGWIPRTELGYLDWERGTVQARHLFATYQLLLALTAYILYCIASFIDLEFLGGHFLVPTLSLVLVMLTLGCWGLAGIAFFLDHYRVPLLAPLALLVFSSGSLPQGDYFYQGLPQPTNIPVRTPLTAADIITAHEKGVDANRPMILVATTGGGIQSAAWTARVLTGLNEQIALSNGGFSRNVRLISAVSGGSVGAMYFTASYQNGEVAQSEAAKIVASAEESSLDQVTWGLAYPDLVFGLLPGLKGVGVKGGEIHLSDSGFIFMDRGRMLEASWRKRLPATQADSTLLGWENDAAKGIRPAVIFNSTLVETGDRYLLSSTGFTEPTTDNKAKVEQYQGRWEFSKLYPESDLRVRTAARLSATFPYVTPAARILRNDAGHSEEGRFFRPEPHAVDGGYYDNYGMVSLLDWLNNGLQTVPALHPKIMIIEIRAAPTGQEARPRSSSFGALFQLTNPLQTISNVRGTGQLSHNALDENLMNRIYSSQLCEATFEFSNVDVRGCPRTEPLNWHLTADDKNALDEAWNNSADIRKNIERVQTFMTGGACPQ